MEVRELADLIGKSFSGVDASLNETNARIDRLDERVINANGRLTEIKSRHIETDLLLRRLEQRIDSVVGRVTAIEDQMHKLNAALESMIRSKSA